MAGTKPQNPKPLSELAWRHVWTTYELGQLIGLGADTIYNRLIDADGQKVGRIEELPPDAHVWFPCVGVMIPGRLDHNHHVSWVAAHVHAAYTAAGQAIPPPP